MVNASLPPLCMVPILCTLKKSAIFCRLPLNRSKGFMSILRSRMFGNISEHFIANSNSLSGSAIPVMILSRYPKSYPQWNPIHLTLGLSTRLVPTNYYPNSVGSMPSVLSLSNSSPLSLSNPILSSSPVSKSRSYLKLNCHVLMPSG